MLMDFMLALLLPPVLLLGWVAVQNAWRKQFRPTDDADVLAARGDCGRCGCAEPCRRDEDQSHYQTRRT